MFDIGHSLGNRLGWLIKRRNRKGFRGAGEMERFFPPWLDFH